MTKTKRLILLMLLLLPVQLRAAITATSQDLDEFSFKKGLKMNGAISMENTFYRGSDSIISRDPYLLNLNGSIGFNLWGIDMPFSFCYSNTHKSYTQPFNRFKLDPRYKCAHLLVGYNTLDLSKYTLSDHDFIGVGVELTPEKWTIAGMYGRLRKAIEFNPIEKNYTTVAYRRMGYAAKVAYKADFGGVYEATFFHGYDDEGSLSDVIPDECAVSPQKNTATSVAIGQKFLKKFFVRAEYAFTLFNSNIIAGDGNEYDRYLDAVNGRIGYQDKTWGLSFNYERIAPGYTTLGGYYFTNDVETFSLSPNARFIHGKFNISANVGLQRNNLDGRRVQRTRNMVYSANASYTPNEHWATSLAFSNFNTYTHVKPQAYPYYANSMDSLNFYQVSRSLSGSASYTWGKENVSQSVSIGTSYQCANQLSEDSLTMFSDYLSANLGYSRQIVPLKLSWSTYGMMNYCNTTGIETLYYGPSASISKAFHQEKINATLGVAYNVDDAAGRQSSSLINTSLSASYTLDAKEKKLGSHIVSLSSGYTRRFGAFASSKNNYEFLTSINYRISF